MELKEKIIAAVEKINDAWLLRQIYRFVKNIEGED